LTGADILICVVLLGSTLIGLLRGFVREAVSLVFWIVAIWAAWKFGPLVEPHLGGLLSDPNIAPWVDDWSSWYWFSSSAGSSPCWRATSPEA